MELIERALTEREVKILELARKQAEKKEVNSLNANPMILLGGFIFVVLSYFFSEWLSFLWVAVLSVGIPTAILFLYLVPQAKKSARERQRKIDEVLQRQTITVERYQCTDALVFETWEDQACIWALQIEPEKVMIWPDYHREFGTVLPARQFDVISDPTFKLIMGDHVSNPIDRFTPTLIPASVTGNAPLDYISGDLGEILPTTLDQLLEEAKSWK